MKILNLLLIVCVVIVSSCASDADDTTPAEPQLIIKLKFDPTQVRLNNLGQPSTIPAGNAAQSPTIRRMSANYIEFAPSPTTLLGQGEIIFNFSEKDEKDYRDFSTEKYLSDTAIFIDRDDLVSGLVTELNLLLNSKEKLWDIKKRSKRKAKALLKTWDERINEEIELLLK